MSLKRVSLSCMININTQHCANILKYSESVIRQMTIMWGGICISLFITLMYSEFADAVVCSYYQYGYVRYYSCLSTQYCCGTRSCCTASSGSIYSLWYFWFCLILFILICSGASGAYYRKRQRIIIRTAPVPNVQQGTIVVSATASSGGHQVYPQPPPTYNQVMHNMGPGARPPMGPPQPAAPGVQTGAAPYPVGYNMPPPAYQNGMAVQHY